MEKGNIKITKLCKYGEWHNSTIGDLYRFIAYARYYVDTNRYCSIHYLISFDGEDIWDYWNNGLDEGDAKKERFTKEDIRNYAHELAWNFAESCEGLPLEYAIEQCNDTIKRYA